MLFQRSVNQAHLCTGQSHAVHHRRDELDGVAVAGTSGTCINFNALLAADTADMPPLKHSHARHAPVHQTALKQEAAAVTCSECVLNSALVAVGSALQDSSPACIQNDLG